MPTPLEIGREFRLHALELKLTLLEDRSPDLANLLSDRDRDYIRETALARTREVYPDAVIGGVIERPVGWVPTDGAIATDEPGPVDPRVRKSLIRAELRLHVVESLLIELMQRNEGQLTLPDAEEITNAASARIRSRYPDDEVEPINLNLNAG